MPNDADGCETGHEGVACSASLCGLRTFAASQMASLLPFIVGLILAFAYVYRSQTTLSDQIIAVEVGLTSGLALLFYFIGFHTVEENHTWKLRALRSWARWIELFIRVAILTAFGAGLVGVAIRPTLSGILYAVIGTYALFIVWDILLIKAPRDANTPNPTNRSQELNKLAKRFLLFDSLQLFCAVGAISGYLLKNPLLLGVFCLGSVATFTIWISSPPTKNEVHELGIRLVHLNLWR